MAHAPLMLSLSRATKFFQPVGVEFRHAVGRKRVELRAQIVREEVLAPDAVALGKPYQASLKTMSRLLMS